ncbi:MAG: sialidase family protein [Planctomycetaceae bacterium]
MLRRMLILLSVPAILACCVYTLSADEPAYQAELIFPLHPKHNHAPGIVECPNGDLLASWYRGSGERSSDDVAVYGARKRARAMEWSEAFLMADHPEFPDCNTCMMIDAKQRLWLFWPIILDNKWESCLTNFAVAKNYTSEGPPQWDRQGIIFLKPDDFSQPLLDHALPQIAKVPRFQTEAGKAEIQRYKERAANKLYQRLGWQPRCKPTVLPSGRILLPLYCDTFSISLMAISDDGGSHWYASKPLIGVGAIQPTVLRRNDGTLVAYMRENGPKDKIRVSESSDEGISWGPVGVTDLPNPGAGIDGVRLADGQWLLVYNDTTRGRNSLAVSISDDEGKTWKVTRHLEKQEKGSYHYPSVIQGKDGTIHAVYSYSPDDPQQPGQSMKHAAFNAAWVRAGK